MLTLISASAGYGKTTLAVEWVRRTPVPVCWYSIDESDNDLVQFCGYLLSAVQSIEPSLGEGLLAALEGASSPEIEDLIISLVNEISLMDKEFIFILDDLHHIVNAEIDSALLILVNHLPAQMHLVILTREDPPLPLPRLRARGLLTEIRAEQLSFTEEEAVDFSRRRMGLHLSSEALQRIHRRTEGWAAGLQMAGLSLLHRDDPDDFLDSFAGTHKFITDYLVEEVLDRQTAAVREFLLRTSILERMTGSLCDAVTGHHDGREMLDQLDRNNMLLVPLDERQEWFRYHQLLTGVLRAMAVRDRRDEVAQWHCRASRWYERHEHRVQAILHALQADNVELTADLVERTWPELNYGVTPMRWLSWAEQIPSASISQRPVLSAAYAWMLLDKGELESAGEYLRCVDRYLEYGGEIEERAGEFRVSNTTEHHSLAGSTEAAKAYYALISRDLDRACEHADRACELLDGEDHFWRGTASLFLGLAHWSAGRFEKAYTSIHESIFHQRAGRNHFYEVFGKVVLAEIRLSQGRLNLAYQEYQRILKKPDAETRTSTESQLIQDPVALHGGLGELERRWGNLSQAEEHLNRGIDIRGRAVLPATTYRLFRDRARLRESQGRLDEALDDLDQAAELYRPGAVPDLYPIDALRARIWLRQGRLQDALEWAEGVGFRGSGAIPFLDGFATVTRARIRIVASADQKNESALAILAGLTAGGGSDPITLEALILQAIAHHQMRDWDAARSALEQVLGLAEPESYVQAFVDEAGALEDLLIRMLPKERNPRFLKEVLRRMRNPEGEDHPSADANRLLVEPLSPREIEILDLINEGLTNQAVADRLFIALSTVKKHLNNIFGKLAVKSRTETLRRARDLELL